MNLLCFSFFALRIALETCVRRNTALGPLNLNTYTYTS